MVDIHIPRALELDNDAQKAMKSSLDATVGRRQMLGGAGVLAAGLAMMSAPDARAMTQSGKKQKKKAQVSEHARAESIDPASYELPRFISDKTGPYDLDDPLDQHYAWLKANHNLGGYIDWYAQFGWIMLCPPGEAPYPFLGRISLGQSHLTPADPSIIPDVGPHDVMSYATFTTMHVDVRTLNVVDEIRNPYTGEYMDLSPIKYADSLATRFQKSILVPGVDPKFYEQPWDRENNFNQHFYDAGEDIAYTVLGAAQKPGPMQPRLDTAFWNVKRKDLMDPRKKAIDCVRNYAAVFKASEYAFTTVPMGDETQMFVQTQGMRSVNSALIPKPCRYLMNNFPERYKFV